MRLLAPFGLFGCGNIGDEATLQGFARLLALGGAAVRASVASRDRAHTARVEPSFAYHRAGGFDWRRWWAGLRADAVVFIGGTPIMDVFGAWPLSEVARIVRTASRRRQAVSFIGIGAETLAHEPSWRLVSEQLATRVARWSVRSRRDEQRLVAAGVPPERVTVAADLAWLVDRVSLDFGHRRLVSLRTDPGRPLVGVNVTNEKFVQNRHPRLLATLAALLDLVVEKAGADIAFFCNEVRDADTFDRAASARVIGHMTRADRAFIVPNQYWTPQEMLSLIGACSLTIGMRYHFCMFSALQGVPFIAITRSDKVADLCWDVDWPYATAPADVDVESVFAMVTAIDAQTASLGERLAAITRRMRERSRANLLALGAADRGTGPATGGTGS